MLSQFRSIALAGLALSMSGCTIVISQQEFPPEATATGRPPSLQQFSRSPAQKRILYVNSAIGRDLPDAGHAEAQPFRTIAYALQQASAGTVIQLAPGEYAQDTGETFPLQLKPGVTLRGNETQQGESIKIMGGGDYLSPTWAKQNVAIAAAENTEIAGVTVTNPHRWGTAVWVESTSPTIRNSRLIDSDREGIFVTGSAAPKIENNRIANNGGNGISLTHEATGEIRGNLIENTGFGLAIGGNAAPVIAENQIRNNLDGLVISHAARPILRDNAIAENRRDGLVAISESIPDLGTATDAGNNLFSNNGRYDIHNAAQSGKLMAVGNELKGDRAIGVQLQ